MLSKFLILLVDDREESNKVVKTDQSILNDLVHISPSHPWFESIPTDFVDPKNLQIDNNEYIHLAVILKNLTAANDIGFKLRINFSHWLNSIVVHTNR